MVWVEIEWCSYLKTVIWVPSKGRQSTLAFFPPLMSTHGKRVKDMEMILYFWWNAGKTREEKQKTSY